MRRVVWLMMVVAIGVGGCGAATQQPASESRMFGAVSFRIHPTFTQIKDWTGDGKPDGVEAVLEFQDQFGEPTRATGNVRFELYTFEAAYPDHRGYRLAMWSTTLNGKDDQVSRWDAAARGYTFQLATDKLNAREYVLTAQVDRGNSRLFDQLVLEMPSTKPTTAQGSRRTQHAPSNGPGHDIY